MSRQAYYSEEDRCWFVPVASELLADEEIQKGIEPVRIQLKGDQLWITRLDSEKEQ